MKLAPIALFVYDRPDHVRATLAALAANPRAGESDLFVFSDGPRDAGAQQAVATVRGIVGSVRGFRGVTVSEREANAGLVRSITDGVDRLTREYGRVIVLEDDLITAPRFLEFMNLALDRYEDESRVMQISGYMYPVPTQAAACLLPTVSCWGWATWRRAWQFYDAAGQARGLIQNDAAMRKAFDLDGAYDYADLLERHLNGDASSWGVLWYLSVFARHGLVLHPPQSLVSNYGFDGSGNHRSVEGQGGLGRVELSGARGDFVFPAEIAVDETAFGLVKNSLRRSHRGWRNLLRRWM